MIITTLLAAAAMAFGQGASSLACPLTGEAVSGKGGGSFDYNGARYTVCCAGCAGAFQKDPAKALSSEVLKGKTVGVSLYDPTTGEKIDTKKAKGGSSDFNGVRFYFASAEGKKAFDAEPKKYGTQPKKEALWCAVMNHSIDGYASAGAYMDHGDTRYYVCCSGCLGKLKENTPALAAKIANKVSAPKAAKAKG